jgi:hypothetical protein
MRFFPNRQSARGNKTPSRERDGQKLNDVFPKSHELEESGDEDDVVRYGANENY